MNFDVDKLDFTLKDGLKKIDEMTDEEKEVTPAYDGFYYEIDY